MNKESIEDALDLLYYLQNQGQGSGNISAALQFFEQNKASGLFVSLKDLEARKALGLPDSILVKENQITKELAYRRSLLTAEENSKKSDADKIELYQSKIFELEQEQRFLIQKLEKDYPQYYQLKYEQSFPGISELQAKLTKGQSFLEYFWGENHIYILALTKDEAILKRVELSPHIHAVFSEFRKKIKDGDQALNKGLELEYFKSLCTESFQLYSWFLDSVLIQLPQTKSLLIVPDGLLNYLPFESLITKEPDSYREANYMGLSFLLKEYPINYQYSARLFLNALQLNDRSAKAETPILSIAPDYQNASPFPQDVENLLRTSDTRDGFSPLTHNQEEANYIKNIWKGVSLVGLDATESNFKSQMGKSQILHFAMHAFSDDQDPMKSGLVFNPSNSGQGEDGILYSHEIYTMDFQAELAILSACNTGAGMLSEGEGVMSLARAFAYAGVPSTSMSLWRANDETISQIMQSFHMYLNQGMEKSAAMQKAKLDFLESSDRTHPYFWAAFLTIGDDSPIDQNNFPLWAYFLIGLLMLIGLYVILKRNK